MTAKYTIQAENATRWRTTETRRATRESGGTRRGRGVREGEGLVAVMAEIRESIAAMLLIQLKNARP